MYTGEGVPSKIEITGGGDVGRKIRMVPRMSCNAEEGVQFNLNTKGAGF